jgi:hypothetical protein
MTSARNTGTPIFEVFRQRLQCDGFAGTGGTGDQPVAVGQSGSSSQVVWGVFAINIGSAMKVP